MGRLSLLSLLSLQLLAPAWRARVAAFDVLMVIGKLAVIARKHPSATLAESFQLCRVPDYQDLETFFYAHITLIIRILSTFSIIRATKITMQHG